MKCILLKKDCYIHKCSWWNIDFSFIIHKCHNFFLGGGSLLLQILVLPPHDYDCWFLCRVKALAGDAKYFALLWNCQDILNIMMTSLLGYENRKNSKERLNHTSCSSILEAYRTCIMKILYVIWKKMLVHVCMHVCLEFSV